MSKTRGQHLNLGRIHLGKIVWDIFEENILRQIFDNFLKNIRNLPRKVWKDVLDGSKHVPNNFKKFDFPMILIFFEIFETWFRKLCFCFDVGDWILRILTLYLVPRFPVFWISRFLDSQIRCHLVISGRGGSALAKLVVDNYEICTLWQLGKWIHFRFYFF